MSNRSRDTSRAARARAALEARQAAERRRRVLVGGAVAAVLVLVVLVGYLVSSGRDATGETPRAVPDGVSDDYAVVVGEDSAPTTITVYEDLQCPVCRAYEGEVAADVARAVERGEVKVEYRLVAFLDQASTTAYSSRALNALMVVLDQEGADAFEAFHAALYEHQPEEGTAGLSDEQLIEHAVRAGADRDAVTGPIEDQQFRQWVLNATDQMSRDGVTGTPTVLIDGKLAGATPADSAKAVLAAVS